MMPKKHSGPKPQQLRSKRRSAEPRSPRQTPDRAPVPVLLLAPAFLVIDKPAGLAVHPGPRTPESLEAMLEDLRFGYTEAPILMHRLDRDTSGCLLLARRKSASRKLAALFETRQIGKTYWAITDGVPTQTQGVIDAPLRKVSSPEKGWRMTIHPQGQGARTGWRLLGQHEGRAWLELTPQTGRTHQLRVHCASMGCPIAGDPVYGATAASGMMLHARSLTIPWVHTAVTITAEPPLSFASLLAPMSQTGTS